MHTRSTAVLFTAAVLVLTSLLVSGAPVQQEEEEEEVTYDQRQNGSENYRVHVNDVVVAVTPLETVMALMALADGLVLPGLGQAGGAGNGEDAVHNGPSTPAVEVDGSSAQPPEAESEKPAKHLRGKMRLSNLLLPLLRRV